MSKNTKINSFPKTEIVTDRFHVQKLASEAVQEERIRLRWDIIELENTAIEQARKKQESYNPEILDNGDTHKQLLARSRYLLFKAKTKWTVKQIERAEILFKLHPTIEKAYDLAQGLSYVFENNTIKDVARLKLAHWYNKVENSEFKSFNTIARSIQMHYETILNYLTTEVQMLLQNLSMPKLKSLDHNLEALEMSNSSCID